MTEFITSLFEYIFYFIGTFVTLYWLFFIPLEEKKSDIKNTIKKVKKIFGKNEHYEEKLRKERENKFDTEKQQNEKDNI